MNCAYCKHTDGVVYTSLPPKYKCSITGEYHLALDDCDVDFEPIVRCKDCKHYADDGWGFGTCHRPNVDYLRMADEDFCSRAERKDEVE